MVKLIYEIDRTSEECCIKPCNYKCVLSEDQLCCDYEKSCTSTCRPGLICGFVQFSETVCVDKENSCEDCLWEFREAGGCECMNEEGCHKWVLMPEECDECTGPVTEECGIHHRGKKN